MERQFLVQRINQTDNERYSTIMTADELIHYIDMSDCFDEDWCIWEITTFGQVEHIQYMGWQPGCVIEFVNDKGEIVLSGYGTDH